MSNIIIHNGPLEIAVGKHRKESNWKNTEITWSELVRRLGNTHRTAEKYSEYLAAKKPRQDEIKDIGGFVGGYLAGGKRRATSVQSRCIVTLDLDFATPYLWEDFILQYSNAALVYSTHKHSPEAPRLRLLMPLDRPVTPGEYEAISRRLGGNIGIELFDPTTFQPERLMYWPSTAKDGQFQYHFQDGPWLSADDVLATYHNWQDVSEWPVSVKNNELVQRAIKKQGDPLEKAGPVGAWCRSYTISEVIDKYLSDVYDPCDIDNRYTYREGSTSAGLIVYEDKYAYSHHGTDPISGKLCNAFDLVRIHKYGLQDEDIHLKTPSNKTPSFMAMLDLCTQDPAVRTLLGTERVESAQADFAGAIVDTEVSEWVDKLGYDKKGKIKTTIDNVMIILENDPNLKNRFATNDFTKRDMVMGNLPWRRVGVSTRYFTNIDLMGLRNYLEKVYSITNAGKINDAINLVLYKNKFHPIREYLDGLVWDGTPRIDTLIVEYLGAEDIPYVHTCTRKTLLAAVARIYRPGIKFDNVLVLVGRQGAGKSTLVKRLGGEWYCENLTTVAGKEAAEQLHGVWLMEMGELAGLKKVEVEVIKNFISRTEDSYRPAYGEKKETYPRQCIFIGTTNNRDFLRDPTGNRRFWPIDTGHTEPVKDTFTDLDGHEVDQIWAEAVAGFKSGEDLHLGFDMEEIARDQQMDHAEKDDRIGDIEKYLDVLVPENWDELSVTDRRNFLQGDELFGAGKVLRQQISVAEIACELFNWQPRDLTSSSTKSLHTIMQNRPGWERAKGNRITRNHGYQRCYIRTGTKGRYGSQFNKQD